MIILGIETSCDDTGVSLLKVSKKQLNVLANFLSSQAKLHAPYGGVWPTLAKREHKKNLPFLWRKVLKKIGKSKIDLIAVTIGPGLEPCLWQGINFAKNLAKKFNSPIVPVNHLEIHLLINFFFNKNLLKIQKLFPSIGLIVSGGHTQLVLIKKIREYKILGETRDDAAGECLDKVARLLGLGYPGGPIIEKLTKSVLTNKTFKIKIRLPRPMINQKNYDFSFAGLKTAVLYDFKSRSEKVKNSLEYKIQMAKEVQSAIIEVLVTKTFRAVNEYKTKSLILGGGVTANQILRKKFKEQAKKQKVRLLMPEKFLCSDNGLNVAFTGYLRKELATQKFDQIIAEPNLKI